MVVKEVEGRLESLIGLEACAVVISLIEEVIEGVYIVFSRPILRPFFLPSFLVFSDPILCLCPVSSPFLSVSNAAAAAWW